nr:nucleocapsid [Wugcerasp virus 12]
MSRPAITPEDLDNAQIFLTALTSETITDELLALQTADMAYQGFDAKTILAVLQKYANDAGLTAEDHKRNLKTLAVLATMRGSKMTNIINKSLEASKAWMTQMISTYKIISKKPTSNTDITLLRIAACMAIPICKAIHTGSIPIATTIDPNVVSHGFPKAMCLSTFGSIIPTECLSEDDTRLLGEAFGEHQYQFDRVINSKDGKFSSIAKIKQFLNIQMTSTVYNCNQRCSALASIGLIEPTIGNGYRIVASHRPALSAARDKFIARA